MQVKTILNRVQKFKSFVYGAVRFVDAAEAPRIEVQVRPRANSRALCSGCGDCGPGYDRLPTRRFELVPLWGIKLFLVYAPRRVDSTGVSLMNKRLLMFLIVATTCADVSGGGSTGPETGALCSDTWYQWIEEKLPTGDGRGHGPDIGSDEWESVIEFKLGIRGMPNVPSRNTEAWCAYVDQMVRTGRTSSMSDAPVGGETGVEGPSYACDGVKPGSIEAMICDDKELSALDLKLSGVYKAASKKATNEHPPLLKAEQRGWIKGRNECWKSEDKRGCVRGEYLRRIAELQARYRLVPGNGPFSFICEGNPANEVVATFFQTEPPTLIAEHGDSVSLMYLQPSGSGTKYQGRNETFWEHQGEALITWGYGAPQMRCNKAQ